MWTPRLPQSRHCSSFVPMKRHPCVCRLIGLIMLTCAGAAGAVGYPLPAGGDLIGEVQLARASRSETLLDIAAPLGPDRPDDLRFYLRFARGLF